MLQQEHLQQQLSSSASLLLLLPKITDTTEGTAHVVAVASKDAQQYSKNHKTNKYNTRIVS
jgi:hypothetical protein